MYRNHDIDSTTAKTAIYSVGRNSSFAFKGRSSASNQPNCLLPIQEQTRAGDASN